MYKNIHFTEPELTAIGVIKEILKLFQMKWRNLNKLTRTNLDYLESRTQQNLAGYELFKNNR